MLPPLLHTREAREREMSELSSHCAEHTCCRRRSWATLAAQIMRESSYSSILERKTSCIHRLAGWLADWLNE